MKAILFERGYDLFADGLEPTLAFHSDYGAGASPGWGSGLGGGTGYGWCDPGAGFGNGDGHGYAMEEHNNDAG